MFRRSYGTSTSGLDSTFPNFLKYIQYFLRRLPTDKFLLLALHTLLLFQILMVSFKSSKAIKLLYYQKARYPDIFQSAIFKKYVILKISGSFKQNWKDHLTEPDSPSSLWHFSPHIIAPLIELFSFMVWSLEACIWRYSFAMSNAYRIEWQCTTLFDKCSSLSSNKLSNLT